VTISSARLRNRFESASQTVRKFFGKPSGILYTSAAPEPQQLRVSFVHASWHQAKLPKKLKKNCEPRATMVIIWYGTGIEKWRQKVFILANCFSALVAIWHLTRNEVASPRPDNPRYHQSSLLLILSCKS
jgi:hypothetical protein